MLSLSLPAPTATPMGKSTSAFKLTTPDVLLVTDELLDFDEELLDFTELAIEEEITEEITDDAIELDDFTLDEVERIAI